MRMKCKTKMRILFIILIASIASTQIIARTYHVENKQSKVSWLAKKIGGEHRGTIQVAEGLITEKDGQLSGSISIDMNSIRVMDLQDPEKNAKLIGHLKSDDFFNTTAFPRATLLITGSKNLGKNQYQINGKLTIREKTNPVQFSAIIQILQSEFKARGKMTIDRSKFNVKFRSASFFEGLGDKLIYDDFELTFEVVARQVQ